MNKTVYDLLLKLEQCDDKHNRCDYLMEHNEITYLLEYIEMLEERRKQSIKQKEVLDKIKEKVKELDRFDPCGSMAVSMSISQFQEDLEILLEEIE